VDLETEAQGPAGIDWAAVRRTVLEVDYALRYEYPGPVRDLRQLLMLVPIDRHGAQTLLSFDVRSDPFAHPRFGSDRFGNRLCYLSMAEAPGALEMGVCLRVDLRCSPLPSAQEEEADLYLSLSPLAEPSPAIEDAARMFASAGDDPGVLAERIMHWVHAALRYETGATDVSTTADLALAQGAGVCQDFSHLMIALCREAGLPARYVSGHMLDEGVMHAWVEVLVDAGGGCRAWQAFDPTHDCRAGLPYVTVAVGRDFTDVSPTRGSFRAPYAGRLAAVRKRWTVIEVEA
jgi:transglutaminase-like putative cysteine protease